MQGIIKTF